MKKRATTLLALMLMAGAAESKVVIHGTRFIYDGGSREELVRVSNLAEKDPSVVQVWIDQGDEASSPDTVDVPFVVTPPVFRIEPGGSQAIRIAHTGEPMPTFRETLYWLNVLEIPPVTEDTTDGAGAESLNARLQFSYRMRLKAFYRPKGLQPHVSEAPAKLGWSLQPGTASTSARLVANNPTPYYISFSKVALVQGETHHERKREHTADGSMVAPFAQISFELPSLKGAAGPLDKVEFVTIGDYGQDVSTSAPLGSAPP